MITAIRAVYDLLMRISIPLLLVIVALAACSIPPTWKWATASRHLRASEARVERLSNELSGAKASLALCQFNSDRLTTALETQNNAIDALRAESDARTARANAAIARAQAQAKALHAKIRRLEQATPSADACSSARAIIVETLGADR